MGSQRKMWSKRKEKEMEKGTNGKNILKKIDVQASHSVDDTSARNPGSAT